MYEMQNRLLVTKAQTGIIPFMYAYFLELLNRSADDNNAISYITPLIAIILQKRDSNGIKAGNKPLEDNSWLSTVLKAKVVSSQYGTSNQ